MPGADDRAPRHTVELTGFGLLPDGTTFGLTVVDLSYDGCKARTDFALEPGARLKFSITGLGSAIEVAVRWAKDGVVGLEFLHEDEGSKRVEAPRKYERIALNGHISLRRVGRQHYQARLFDLTPTGCKVEFVERPKQGEMLWARFDGLEPVEAAVRWVDGFYGGLEFLRPIHPAVFDVLLCRLQTR